MTQSAPGRAAFIVLEGIDGAGTTTQAQRLAERIRGGNAKVLVTNQPSSGPVGSLVRLALTRRVVGAALHYHDPVAGVTNGHPTASPPNAVAPESLDFRTMALLFAADRMDHVAALVTPSLEQGRHVVCDRYLLSSLAYQGTEVEPEWILEINRFAPRPDVTIFLDLDVDEAMNRMRRSRWTRDVYENRDLQLAVRDRYHHSIARYGSQLGRIETLNAEFSADEVERRVWGIISPLLSG